MADPDLQIRGEGGGGGLIKKMFRHFGPHFGLKIRGNGPPGPSPGSPNANKHTRAQTIAQVSR